MIYHDVIIKAITSSFKYLCVSTAHKRSYLNAKVKVRFSFQTQENQRLSQKQQKK